MQIYILILAVFGAMGAKTAGVFVGTAAAGTGTGLPEGGGENVGGAGLAGGGVTKVVFANH